MKATLEVRAKVQVWNWASDAFGVGTPTGSATVNLRFTGQYWDSESSLHYNWNRYYDPTTGRYITSDPIGLAGGLNTYGYALANPVMYIDPEGLQSINGVIIDIVAGGLDRGVKGIIKRLTPRKQCPYNPDSVLNNTADDGENKDTKPEGAEEGKKPQKTPEDILDEAENVDSSGNVTNGEKPGGQAGADKDFDDIVDPDTVDNTKKGGRVW